MPRKPSENPHTVYMREWRARGGPAVERVKAAERLWKENNRDKMKRYARQWAQRNRYGFDITRQEELAIYEASDGLCAICYEEPATHIDHDHVTGEVRGALCGNCNRGMGLFGDDIERLQSAVRYLEEPLLIEA